MTSDEFAEHQRLEKQLKNDLPNCPRVEVVGLVDPSGPGAIRSQGDELWTFVLDFVAWRIKGEPLRKSPMRAERPVTDEELDSLEEEIDADFIIGVRGRLSEQGIDGSPRMLIEEFLGVVEDDDEITQELHTSRLPVELVDQQFGRFEFDRRYDQFSAPTQWNGIAITLELEAGDTEAADRCLNSARQLWASQEKWQEAVTDLAVEQLLETKNEYWVDDGETQVTASEFKSRMLLQSISVSADGEFTFWHNDGDLFFGHLIQITGSLSEGCTHADIPG